MRKIAVIFGIVLLLALVAFGYYLLRPLANKPTPARIHCYAIAQGAYVPLDPPPQAFGIGLSYAAHIEETASKFDVSSTPPIFRKHPRTLVRTGATVIIPGTDELVAAAESLEPRLGEAIRQKRNELSPLLDYEVEMGFVLLEDIDPAALDDASFAPQVGFFIANDLSARTLAILGEGQRNRFGYWGVSKSFPGFMPVTDRAWVPKERPNPTAFPASLSKRQSTMSFDRNKPPTT